MKSIPTPPLESCAYGTHHGYSQHSFVRLPCYLLHVLVSCICTDHSLQIERCAQLFLCDAWQRCALRLLSNDISTCRFHASALVCLLVRCACDPRHSSPDTPALLEAVVHSSLLPRVAHLAFASPSCSCLHTAFLDALSIHTLPRMPAAVWQPLLLKNFGLPAETDGVVLDPLPDLLFSHGMATSHLHYCLSHVN